MFSKQTYPIFFFLRKIMTLDIKTKKRALLHVQSACDKASVCVCVYIYIKVETSCERV